MGTAFRLAASWAGDPKVEPQGGTGQMQIFLGLKSLILHPADFSRWGLWTGFGVYTPPPPPPQRCKPTSVCTYVFLGEGPQDLSDDLRGS